MQKKQPVRSLITAILLLSVIWVVFLFSKQLHEKKDYELERFVPKDAVITLRINSNEILKEAIRAMISEEDGSSFEQIIKSLEQRKEENKSNLIGLDLQSDVIVFMVKLKYDHHLCILSGIENQRALSKKKPELEQDGIGVAYRDDVALLILPVKDGKLSKSDLSIQATRLLSKTLNPKGESNSKSSMVLTIPSSAQNFNAFAAPGQVEIDLKENSITLNGEFLWDEEEPKERIRLLKPQGIHISIPKFSADVQDSIRTILLPLGFTNEEITGCSINYNGLLIEEVPGLKLLPDFNGLFHFAKAVERDSIIAQLSRVNDMIIPTADGFTYGSKTYYVRSITTQSLYIGRTPYNERFTRLATQDLIVESSGDLSHLTELEGKGMLRKLVELLSLFAASKEFVNKTDHFYFEATRGSSGKGVVKSQLHFKSGESASLALLNFLFDAKYIR